ncbi:hypothetical protein ASD54_14300 [Rhizobium sp. Root149]|nr:hypothetical protein ASD54_14300 [Rhizobium sp. Root149]KRA03848.1 hypothetical protein ASD74_22925 [Rhizobium sp. Root564]PZU79256.1 MAG: hypothetical protein DI546_01115 [Rhizobium sp.]
MDRNIYSQGANFKIEVDRCEGISLMLRSGQESHGPLSELIAGQAAEEFLESINQTLTLLRLPDSY